MAPGMTITTPAWMPRFRDDSDVAGSFATRAAMPQAGGETRRRPHGRANGHAHHTTRRAGRRSTFPAFRRSFRPEPHRLRETKARRHPLGPDQLQLRAVASAASGYSTRSRKSPRRMRSAMISSWISSAVRKPSRRNSGCARAPALKCLLQQQRGRDPVSARKRLSTDETEREARQSHRRGFGLECAFQRPFAFELADPLVDEHRIGADVTRDVVQGARVDAVTDGGAVATAGSRFLFGYDGAAGHDDAFHAAIVAGGALMLRVGAGAAPRVGANARYLCVIDGTRCSRPLSLLSRGSWTRDRQGLFDAGFISKRGRLPAAIVLCWRCLRAAAAATAGLQRVPPRIPFRRRLPPVSSATADWPSCSSGRARPRICRHSPPSCCARGRLPNAVPWVCARKVRTSPSPRRIAGR